MDTKMFLSANDVLYKDFLLKLEEEPTPENMKKLHEKIDELETKLVSQTKASQQRELELQRLVDENKGKWIVKYLEAKMQIENMKAFYQDGKNFWQKDLKNLFAAIKILFKTIKDKDSQNLEMLKDIERELSSVFTASLNLSSSN
jgi:hypothetical protein